MPLYPAIKLMDTVITDLFDFQTTDPNASVPAHTPEWSNLRSSDPMETPGPDDNVAGLPAVQTDDGLLLHDDAAYSLGQSMGFSPDAFDFTTEPTAPDGFGR